jgi:putative transposase
MANDGISFARHQFPPDIIWYAVWLHLHFTFSFRDVDDLSAERGLDVSYETVRRMRKQHLDLVLSQFRGCLERRVRPEPDWEDFWPWPNR